MTLILASAVALANPILSPFVNYILDDESKVGLFFSFLGIMTLIAALASSFIFRKVERTTIAKVGFLIFAFIYFALVFMTELIPLTILLTLKTSIQMLLLITIGLFVRDFAKAKKLGKEEGLHYRFQNIGALVGALLGGFLATNFDYEFVFIIASTVLIFGFAYFYQKHIVEAQPGIINRKRTSPYSLWHNVKEFFSHKERAKAYAITVGLMLWMGFSYLFVPLYVLRSGYLDSMSGLILAITMLPLIFMEVKVGDYADKKGIHKPIALGFLIIGIISLVIFLNPIHLLNFLLIACVSVGSAMIEPLQEAYLFKNLPEEREEDLYGIYMTADPVAYFLAPTIAAVVLFYLPFKFLFLCFGILMLLMSLFAWKTLKGKASNSD